MSCEKLYLGLCWVMPQDGSGSVIFGFSDFIKALAILIIVYTVTDTRYRFRVAVTPIPLRSLTFWLIGVIGSGTLLVDIWFAKRWLIPDFLAAKSIWHGTFGAMFLSLIMLWIYYAFRNPPIFSARNYRRFAQELYKIILKGSDSELSVIANELARSASAIVKLSREYPSDLQKEINGEQEEKKNKMTRWNAIKSRLLKKPKPKPSAGDFAHDVLLLIGNRKLCRHIIESSPVTAMAFFEAIATNEKYRVPMGQFARNISTEAIINKDSILYHEDEGYSSGLIGYLKPFSQTIYGNYRLVETLDSNHGSPLDIHYKVVSKWDASQFEAYCRAVLITLGSYLSSGNWPMHSYALYRALENIKNSCTDLYKLNDINSDYSADTLNRLMTAVNFIEKAVELIGEQRNPPTTILRIRGNHGQDFYDHIAHLMFKIIFYASSVTTSPDNCWSIQHNTVWSQFFGLYEGKAWQIIRFKLRRLLYDEIRRMEKFPNYKSSRILGFCLNVMGLKVSTKKGYGRDYYPLHNAVLAWTRRNYLRLRSVQPDVAESCLISSISFDEQGARLVKTYPKGLKLEAPKQYLELSETSDDLGQCRVPRTVQ